MKVTTESTFRWAKVFIDGALHICLDKDNLAGVQSWRNTGIFVIEFNFKSGDRMRTEYGKESLWHDILEAVNKALYE